MFVEDFNDLREIRQRAGQSVDLVEQDDIDLTFFDIGKQPFERWPIHRAAGEPAIIITVFDNRPAFVALALGIGFTGVILSVEAVIFLFKAILGRFAGVDGTANNFASARHVSPALSSVRRIGDLTSARPWPYGRFEIANGRSTHSSQTPGRSW